MPDEDKKFSKQLIGKTVVSKSGKKFGEVGDIVFETKTGELIHLVLSNPTPYIQKLELEKDDAEFRDESGFIITQLLKKSKKL